MYSVQDPVNRYRHGVLLGNYVQDKFGRDLYEKGANEDAKKIGTTKQYHDINHSLYKKHQIINQHEPNNQVFYQTGKKFAPKKQEATFEILQYKKPQEETTYDIFYRQEVQGKVPVLKNNAKKQMKMAEEGKLYENTRYYLANKFNPNKHSVCTGTMYNTMAKNQYEGNTGGQNSDNDHDKLGNRGIQDEEIPDVLTGQIWKAKQTNSIGNNGNKALEAANAKSINPHGTYSLIRPQIQKFDQQQYKRLVQPNQKGEQRDILFGHGLNIEDFHKKQMATTYDLSYNQQIKPQTQINSFYDADPTQTAKHFHRQTIYEKNHQNQVPFYGDKTLLNKGKIERPYRPYTKTYDENHLKHQYLRK